MKNIKYKNWKIITSQQGKHDRDHQNWKEADSAHVTAEFSPHKEYFLASWTVKIVNFFHHQDVSSLTRQILSPKVSPLLFFSSSSHTRIGPHPLDHPLDRLQRRLNSVQTSAKPGGMMKEKKNVSEFIRLASVRIDVLPPYCFSQLTDRAECQVLYRPMSRPPSGVPRPGQAGGLAEWFRGEITLGSLWDHRRSRSISRLKHR